MWKRMMIIGLLLNAGLAAVPATAANVDYNFRWEASRNTFTGGLYYPILTADYIEFAYAPGLRILSMVQINQRKFLIRSIPGLH